MPWYCFPVFIMWIRSEYLLGRISRPGDGSASGRDRSTLRMIWLTLLPSIFLAVLVSIPTRPHICLWDHFQDFGLFVMMAGSVLRLFLVPFMWRFVPVLVIIGRSPCILSTSL